MDRKQAAEIQRHLLEASNALKRAMEATRKLDKAERRLCLDWISELDIELQFTGLRKLYAEHPELEPPREPPQISSTLRWEEVSLPESISEAAIDAVIFEMLTPKLRKTAVVISRTFDRFRAQATPISNEIIGARVVALAEAGRIEGAGDLRMWRHSELRLPQSIPARQRKK